MDAVMLKLLVECCWIFPKIASRATEGPTVKCQVHRRLHNYHSSRSGRCVTWINPASRLAGQPGTLVQSPHLSAMAPQMWMFVDEIQGLQEFTRVQSFQFIALPAELPVIDVIPFLAINCKPLKSIVPTSRANTQICKLGTNVRL